MREYERALFLRRRAERLQDMSNSLEDNRNTMPVIAQLEQAAALYELAAALLSKE
jgi:hypothetical protein